MKIPCALLFATATIGMVSGGEPGAKESDKLPAALAKTAPSKEPRDEPLVLEKVTVSESRIFRDQLRELDKSLRPYSPPKSLENGAMWHKTLGGRPIEIGVSSHRDLFSEDTKFKATTPMLGLDLLRTKF